MTGAGKTTRLYRLARKARRSIVLDPESKYEAKGETIIEGDPHRLRQYLDHVNALNPRSKFNVIYRDDVKPLGEVGPGLAFAVMNVTLVIDELAWLCEARKIPAYLKKCLQYGRARRVNMLWTTREPQEIHNMVMSQAGLIHFFRVQPGTGLDIIHKRYRSLPVASSEEAEVLLRDVLPDLKTGKFLIYGRPQFADLFGREGLDIPPSIKP